MLLIAASIFAARKLAHYDRPCPAIEATIANSISMAEKIMRKIAVQSFAQSGANVAVLD